MRDVNDPGDDKRRRPGHEQSGSADEQRSTSRGSSNSSAALRVMETITRDDVDRRHKDRNVYTGRKKRKPHL